MGIVPRPSMTRRWPIVDGLVWQRHLTAITGPMAMRPILFQLGCFIASGDTFLGLPVRPHSSMYVSDRGDTGPIRREDGALQPIVPSRISHGCHLAHA